MDTTSLRELKAMIEGALTLADQGQLWSIGVSLDRARIDLDSLLASNDPGSIPLRTRLASRF